MGAYPDMICPICGEEAQSRCKCYFADATCAQGHQWHYCPVHGTVVVGPSDHSLPTDTCTCPPGTVHMATDRGLHMRVAQRSQRAQSCDICPTCGRSAVSSCRCSMRDGTCAQGHQWHTCPDKQAVVPWASTHAGGSCTCGSGPRKTSNANVLSLRVAARYQRQADGEPGGRRNEKDLTEPLNTLRGINRAIVKEHGEAWEKGIGDATKPDRKDIRPEDVFHPKPSQVSVRNLAETGKDLSKVIREQIPKDKGYDAVRNLSQYLITTEGGGGAKARG